MVTQVSREEMLSLVSNKLRAKCLTDLSNQTGISLSCLYNIRDHKTKWPRWTTFQRLLPKLGLVLIITED